MQCAENAFDFRRMLGVQTLLDILADQFRFVEPASGDGSSTLGPTQLQKDDVRELRAYILFLLKQFITTNKDKEAIVLDEDELRRFVTYLSSITNDAEQLVDFVPLLVALLSDQPSSVAEAFLNLGAPACPISCWGRSYAGRMPQTASNASSGWSRWTMRWFASTC